MDKGSADVVKTLSQM